MGNFGNNCGGLGGTVGHFKADSDPSNPSGELSYLRFVYLCNQRGFDHVDDADRTWIFGKGFWHSFVGSGGVGLVERGSGEAKIIAILGMLVYDMGYKSFRR